MQPSRPKTILSFRFSVPGPSKKQLGKESPNLGALRHRVRFFKYMVCSTMIRGYYYQLWSNRSGSPVILLSSRSHGTGPQEQLFEVHGSHIEVSGSAD